MSKNEWEEGTIVLPPADARRIRAALADEHERQRQSTAAEIESFYQAKGSGGRTRETFVAALDEWEEKRHSQISPPSSQSWGMPATADVVSGNERHESVYEARGFAQMRAERGEFGKPLKRDIDAALPKAPKTGRLNVRGGGGYGSATINGKELYWHAEGNRGVESARESRLAKVVFGELKKVKWAKGTGGQIPGNDEYNEESGRYNAGSGGSYATGQFGPLGDPHFMTDAQKERQEKSARLFRAKPGNAGKCGKRRYVHGKMEEPPCRRPAGSCPYHGARRSPYGAW